MKGGITSGVIYPEVVCRLARTYRLRSVGGASAGAIAAAAAAAAIVGLVVLLVGVGIGSALGLARRLVTAVPANGFGLCNGGRRRGRAG